MTPGIGKTVVITGAASGIGAALARQCSAAGANVVLADLNEIGLESLEQELRANGGQVVACRTDVSKPDDFANLAHVTYDAFQACHLLCNNAGVALTGSIQTLQLQNWERLLAVNTSSVVYSLQVFLPRLIAQTDASHILNTASMAGLAPLPVPGFGAYAAAKSAVVAFSEAMRLELAPHGIGVSILCPGIVDTNIHTSDLAGPPPSRQSADAATDDASTIDPDFPDHLMRIISPHEAAAIALAGVARDQFYILTHPEWRPIIEQRFRTILADYPG